MTPHRALTLRFLAPLALTGCLLLAGCADEPGTASEPAPSDTALSPTPSKDGEPRSTKPTKSTKSPATPAPEASAATVQVTIKGDTVEPVAKQVDIGVGDTITIKVDSDRAGELHVHSTPEQTFEFGPGTRSFDITLDKPGTVDVEEHVSDTLLVRALVR